MSIYTAEHIQTLLAGNAYPGRGIIIGKTADAKKACVAYFIMGRSANSRNRVLRVEDRTLSTAPYDVSKVEDPNLIIYTALKGFQNQLILTNGDQTDTVYEGLQKGISFFEALEQRSFEPDAPNYTPRISGLVDFENGDFSYKMSLLKSADEHGGACVRYGFCYPARAGVGHFLHTYRSDGNPLPPFEGEPKKVEIGSDIADFSATLWNALDTDNKIALYVRFIDLKTLEYEEKLINKLG